MTTSYVPLLLQVDENGSDIGEDVPETSIRSDSIGEDVTVGVRHHK